ncbi:MAG: zinc ribbon domain-containing protein [Candidatus Schekmanbacteria bacterium]|nr:zinc ribbon domain-containing protein [Candidatus Schekmanbacteria bacterium]
MPVYEYMCFDCGAITEVLRSIILRDDVTSCGRCGASTERIISRFNTVGPVAPQTFNPDCPGKSRSTAVRLAGGSVKFKNCSFRNFQTGISVAKGSKLSMDGSKFENIDKPIEVTNE